MTDVGAAVGAAVVGYLVGTFPSADLVTRVATRGAVDLRRHGSGNPGGLNAIRVIGRRGGVVVILVDTAKGALAGAIGYWMAGDAGAYLAATAAIIGHCWPVWTRFRGGKGVATAGGSFAVVFPPFFAIGGLIALGTAVATHRSALAISVTCAAWVVAALVWALADVSNAWGPTPDAGLVAYSVVGAAILVGRSRRRMGA